MDAVTNLLADRGWTRRPDLENELRPVVYARGAWKAIVGRLWTTVWRLKAEGQIAELDSHKTDDIAAVEIALKEAALKAA